MKAQLEFKSGEVIEGELGVGRDTMGLFYYQFTSDCGRLVASGLDFETKEQVIQDFKRFGTIIEE